MSRTLLAALFLFLTLMAVPLHGADKQNKFQTWEYLTIRWGGRENTHVIRPTGQVEHLRGLFQGVKVPERTDERSFYMNIALNALAKEGYELSAMTHDDMVLRRSANR